MLYETAIIDGPARITKDGYLVADARVGKANNIQDYSAAELGLTDRAANERVRIFRPADTVFARDSLTSLAHRPITLDHPAADVTAETWRQQAVGDVGSDIVRDGDFIRVPIKIMDAAAVRSVASTRREFSLGYSCKIDMTPGVHDGQAYDGQVRDVRYNHLAAVPSARGGHELRIIDERIPADTGNKGNPPMKIKIGDAEVDASNCEAVSVAVASLNTALADGRAALAAEQARVATLTAEKTAVEKKLADAEAAATPEALEKRVADRAALIGKAKAIKADIVTDGKTEADIRAEVVTAALGDAAKGYTADQNIAAFDVLAKDAKPAADKVVSLVPATVGDGASIISSLRAGRYA